VLFGQLFHPGREIAEADGGLLSVAYAPSSVRTNAFTHASSAEKAHDRRHRARLRRCGPAHADGRLDGVEIVASHGYLPAQFLNPRVNLRDDAYGGDLDGRLRFLRR